MDVEVITIPSIGNIQTVGSRGKIIKIIQDDITVKYYLFVDKDGTKFNPKTNESFHYQDWYEIPKHCLKQIILTPKNWKEVLQ